MRVTHNMMFKAGTSALQSQQQDILKIQESSLTGNRTNRPSDDPTGIYRHMLFSADLTGVQSLKKTTEFASQRLNLADSHVNQIHERMLESKDLALKMSNSSVGGDPEIMKATAENAKAIYLDILKSVNSDLDEIPIFGGSRTRAPYDSKNLQATSVRVRTDGRGPQMAAQAGITASVADDHSVNDLPVSVKVTFMAASGKYEVDVNGIKGATASPEGTPPVLNLGNGIKMTMGANPNPGDVFYFEVVPKYQGGAADRPIKVLNGQTLP
ncbi:MAG TPA: hypothetical protein HPQ00_17595, partial [Magnetococcales bacterium]|nr:hypothetical protein [Magnetococcales bacterium]